MSLIKATVWDGKIYSGGWVPGSGGTYAVTEPATGAELGRLGTATAADVERAATRAAEAQGEWVAAPYHQRAAVLRRAGDLWRQHSEEVSNWIVRETGSIPPKAEFELSMAVQESYEASTLPSLPYGELLRSAHRCLRWRDAGSRV